ncbi:MAG TPA: lysylphosphatidylglycerol synthase transmembrane domain-containing protein [Chloroflexota bacterium]|nr:lysylphosphatidylglycerol synthase transmembrane domain-containing protein [Chloroflexota bacterium]HUM69978.1 lysylphosphatidylglycerol synthase transmembrane domain-containing protein [Chloroflexota bacterium]
MESSQKDRRQLWIGTAVSLLCLIAIFLFINPRDIIDAFRHANYAYLGLTGLGVLLFMLIRAIRWRFMMGNQVKYGQVFHVQNIGYMLNMYLPFRLGDVARAVLMGSVPPLTISQSISTMVVERVLDMMFVVALLPFTLAYAPTLPPEFRRAALLTGVLAVIAIVLLIVAANQRPFFRRLATTVFNFIPRIARVFNGVVSQRPFNRRLIIFIFTSISQIDTETWVRRVDDILNGLDSLTRFKDGVILLFLSVLVWLPIIFAYWIGMQAVGLDVTVPMAAFVVCAAALSIAAPSSPGGVGVFQAGVTAALALLGQPAAASASFAFAYHAVNYIVLTILGLIGIAATGSTIGAVVRTTQNYMKREKGVTSDE